MPAGGDVEGLGLAFHLGIDPALEVIGGATERFMDDALSGGEELGLAIPVVISGEVFFDLPSLGRVGVPFGPFASTWHGCDSAPPRGQPSQDARNLFL